MKAADRLDVIRTEGAKALSNLQGVLALIEGQRPSAELRVLMMNSVIVSAVSTVEEVLRQLFFEYLTIVEERIDSHRKLRGALREANAEKSTEELRKLLKEKREGEALKLLDGLRRCLNGDPGYRIAKVAISYNKGNFRSAQVTEIAKLVGLANLWSKMADDARVVAHTGLPTGPECTDQLVRDWNDIYDERDLVVHRISQASGWGADRVRQGIALFDLVLERFAVCLTQDLLTVIPIEP